MYPSKTNSPFLYQTDTPIGIPPGNGATVGLKFTDTAGAFSLTTSLFPMVYTGGIWLWVPINGFTAATPAAAGLYWATTSTTSVGILYGVTYASTGGRVPTAAQLAAAPGVTTLNRWITQQVTVAAALSVSIPANTMGAAGSLKTEITTSYLNSAGVKTVALKFGGTAIMTQAPTTTAAARYRNVIFNRGTGQQVYATATGINAYTESAGVATANLVMANNTTTAIALAVDLTIAVNTDLIIMETFSAEVFQRLSY